MMNTEETIPNKDLPRVAYHAPIKVRVVPGKVYSWCSCGLTAVTPFCDNTHRKIEGQPFKSIKVLFEKEQDIWFCQCKQTKTPPFCDGSHKALKK